MPHRLVTSFAFVLGAALVPISACVVEPPPPSCQDTCAALGAKGCTLGTSDGTAGGGHGQPTGCEPSCRQALGRAAIDRCTRELYAFMDCLASDAPATCDGETFDDIRGCDAERLAWDTCDGFECDVHGGLSSSGETTQSGVELWFNFAHTECSCLDTPPDAMGVAVCGTDECQPVCCCNGAIASVACAGDRCATAEEVCGVIEAAPYSCGGA